MHSQTVATGPTASYLICCLPRSGSWLMADGLKATGVAGVPEEYYWDEFHEDYLGKWGYPHIGTYDDFLAFSQKVGTTPNGVFGAKMHWEELCQLDSNLRTLPRTAGRCTFELLTEYFPALRFVYLRRQDKVRQAISWFRAGSTASWYTVQGENRANGEEIAPNWERIHLLEAILRHDEESWERFFTGAGVQPLRIAYEDLSRNYESCVRSVLGYLGLPTGARLELPTPRLRVQRDTTTERWVQAYMVWRRRTVPLDDGCYGRGLIAPGDAGVDSSRRASIRKNGGTTAARCSSVPGAAIASPPQSSASRRTTNPDSQSVPISSVRV
jgi:trehalose 2-sulfotransferase